MTHEWKVGNVALGVGIDKDLGLPDSKGMHVIYFTQVTRSASGPIQVIEPFGIVPNAVSAERFAGWMNQLVGVIKPEIRG